jgi:hypothetical protein
VHASGRIAVEKPVETAVPMRDGVTAECGQETL